MLSSAAAIENGKQSYLSSMVSSYFLLSNMGHTEKLIEGRKGKETD